jgi:Uma2 family endonuclease
MDAIDKPPRLAAFTSHGDDGRMSRMAGGDHVTPGAPAVKLTYDDYVLFPEDGKRHELIDGKHYVTPSPNLRHQRVVMTLSWVIRTHLETHPTGEVFVAPLDVILSDHDVVEPDVLYVSNERRAILGTWVHGMPDLVIEVASKRTRRRDERLKRRLYERMGAREYWVVDPEIEIVRVYRADAGAFARPVELSRKRNDVVTTDLLPGLAIPLDQIFSQ